ncbi:putative Glucosidase II beta subunit like protein [Trypanosoma vivax]|uniref:Protein OS9-like domain-containing protein n=1 Tax=Trypanosoma vivax (strain Y486) TaxID=1055687 RepID=G0U2U7_TRYVY|nr:hypothetical protein TRVL_01945 [Trypanosoma vivax]KAH8604135.1 putative Glucosidase II beta subunit like protein [Trypanosoma vivax]CCC50601.1 conserved hypothetical protein [Trypanosoma vivax Y486]
MRPVLRVSFTIVLLQFVSIFLVESCQWAQRLREYEIEIFADLHETNETRPGCFVWNDSYWNYEVCPGRWVRQFFVKDNVIVEEYFLGLQHQYQLRDAVGSQRMDYEGGVFSIPDRMNATGIFFRTTTGTYGCASDMAITHRKQVDVIYPHGSLCEPLQQRSVVMHFVCNENMKKPIIKFREPFLCKYDITVMAASVCDAMYGRSPALKRLSDDGMKFAL